MTAGDKTSKVQAEPTTPVSGRRKLLTFAALMVAPVAFFRGASWVLDQAASNLGFIPVDDPPGFRRLSLVGSTSSAFDPFAGVAAPGEVAEKNTPIADAGFCAALFGRTSFENGVVPVAFFSDFNCPNCELLVDDLTKIAAAGDVHLKRHEWPILGDASQTAARAAIAAAEQGAYQAFARRLQRTSLVPTEGYLRDVAQSAGIDADRLFTDMASDATTHELRTSAALVRRFAFPGTPALIVGRTIVVGTIRTATLEALVKLERAEGPPPGCQSRKK